MRGLRAHVPLEYSPCSSLKVPENTKISSPYGKTRAELYTNLTDDFQ